VEVGAAGPNGAASQEQQDAAPVAPSCGMLPLCDPIQAAADAGPSGPMCRGFGKPEWNRWWGKGAKAGYAPMRQQRVRHGLGRLCDTCTAQLVSRLMQLGILSV
jgi:hypothetical protein